MASIFYNIALEKILDGTLDLGNETLKILLVDDTYTEDKTHDSITDIVAGGKEITATNYTGGHNGAGRKTVDTVTVYNDSGTPRINVGLSNVTWTNIGGSGNDAVIGGAVLFKQAGNDNDSIPIAFFDITNTNTNGSDLQLQFVAAASGGNIRFTP